MYSIGRRYDVSIANIEEADPSVKDGLDPNDIIMVPSWKRGTFKTGNNTPTSNKADTKTPQPKPEVKKQPEPKAPAGQEKTARQHVVQPGETLFSIAKKHKISVSDIQKWNSLKDHNIITGQKLTVGYYMASYLEGVPDEPIGPEGSENNPNLKQDHIDQKIAKEYEDAQKKSEADRKKGIVEIKEVNESGVATWIDDGTVVSEKKLALHRTAAPGTIIQLTNPRTGKKVFVKVIGKLPDAVDEKNVLIKVTKNTAEELGAIDQFFRVNMKYGVEVYASKSTSKK